MVVASQILGLAFFKAGKYPQCYSVFGGERRGAPLVSFLRVDEKKILLKCEIRHPGELVCFDDSLVNPKEIKEMLFPKGRILINTRQPLEAFAELKEYRLGLIDALSISTEMGLGKIINTTMVGAYCCFTGHLKLDRVLESVQELAPTKIEENMEAVRRAFEVMKDEYSKEVI